MTGLGLQAEVRREKAGADTKLLNGPMDQEETGRLWHVWVLV